MNNLYNIIKKYNRKILINNIKNNYEEYKFIETLNISNKYYIETGANSKSSKKCDYLHKYIKQSIEDILPTDNYKVKLEQKIKSINMTGDKKCDIVLYKNNNPYIIFPCKYIMSSYYKNKNNYWENITGELIQIKWGNKDIYI